MPFIYKLICSKTGHIYYGSSSKKTLKERKSKGWYLCSCKDFVNPEMIKLEDVCEENRLERENYYIKNNDCVNKNDAILSLEKIKKWKQKNKERKKQMDNLYKKKIKDSKKFYCNLCDFAYITQKKLDRHIKGYRHKLKYESYLKYGDDWEKYYKNDNKIRYNENRRKKS